MSSITTGVIEGFFGKPWPWLARLDNAGFLRDCGYQFYIYAPKSDAFLRRKWREPMPADTQRQLADLASRCRQEGIAFGVGLTPFEIHLNYDEHAHRALRSKLRQIEEIGVDILCILFDDMRGDVDGLAELQASVVSDVCAASSAKRFIVCPTYYSHDPLLAQVFGPAPAGYLRDLGRLLDARIDLFWTGEKVISSGYSREHLENVADDMRRKPYIWDNHIANDSRLRASRLFLDPADSWRVPLDRVSGVAINPMNQPYLSRIALDGYMRLLRDPSSKDFKETCRRLCGSTLAERLLGDIDLLQARGLDQLDEESRRELSAWYEARKDDPYANEIAAWVRGDYVFDPQCLTT